MSDDLSEAELAVNAQGQRLIAEIERLQVYVLDELDALHDRITTVFRSYGYKEAVELSAEPPEVASGEAA